MTEQTNPALFTFVKLTVRDIDAMTRFFAKGFDMTHVDTVDTPEFREHMMAGKKGSATIVLFHWKDGRAIEIGNGWGPVGLISRDVESDRARAIAAGASPRGEIVNFGKARIAFVKTPEGHEIEMMQMG
ncbi:VOC family protein [Pontixanthobacter aquaemixtae]|uniref:VOC family protein n=1 Tax=Pontixanthobacter aquaemixtae TaxID=1958940 RepID=A0A844ZRZ6_9SPHN|nr:VOC family protein [Pontixanthobacter aquaemixtae]MXO89870.1 VOC family protein [Pontixanthobacter aquaemixtae]